MLEGNFLSFPEADAEVASAFPNGWTLVEGNPEVRNRRLYVDADKQRFSGVWECSPGKFKVDYKVWEFCHLIKGQCVITHESGRQYILNPGDSFILEPGFVGDWQVTEAVEKRYVILA